MKKPLRSKWVGIVIVAVIACLVFAGTLFTVKVVFPAYAITTGSMEPVLPVGSLVFTAPNATPRVGEIIAFPYNGEIVVHRLIKINPDGMIVTKGDANDSVDNHLIKPVYEKDVLGVVVKQEILTAPGFWLHLNIKGYIFFGLMAVVLILGLVLSFSKDKRCKDELEDKNEISAEETRTSDPVRS